uniref:LigA n=1 Tax=Parastrongyloides trichosuri TaxID=131310 RepID=A0A0N4ZD63_PARTI
MASGPVAVQGGAGRRRLHRRGGGHLQAGAVADAGSGGRHPRGRGPGGQVRRDRGHHRSHEDAEHPQGRARRQGEGGQGQGRRSGRRRRRAGGVRVNDRVRRPDPAGVARGRRQGAEGASAGEPHPPGCGPTGDEAAVWDGEWGRACIRAPALGFRRPGVGRAGAERGRGRGRPEPRYPDRSGERGGVDPDRRAGSGGHCEAGARTGRGGAGAGAGGAGRRVRGVKAAEALSAVAKGTGLRRVFGRGLCEGGRGGGPVRRGGAEGRRFGRRGGSGLFRLSGENPRAASDLGQRLQGVRRRGSGDHRGALVAADAVGARSVAEHAAPDRRRIRRGRGRGGCGGAGRLHPRGGPAGRLRQASGAQHPADPDGGVQPRPRRRSGQRLLVSGRAHPRTGRGGMGRAPGL